MWERFNRMKAGKGYAIDFLLKRIEEAYPDRPFDGYFIFDADNLLDEDYINEMNRLFSEGHRIITSYRNSKIMEQLDFSRNFIMVLAGIPISEPLKNVIRNQLCRIRHRVFVSP